MGLVHIEDDGQVFFYAYTPSKAAGYIFMALFIAITAVHIRYIWKLKTKYFIPMALGGVCEIFGHLGRAWASDEPKSPRPFMLQLMLILVAPVFISATVYVTLGRLKQTLLGHPKRKCSPTIAFVLTDIIAFCTQIGGSLVQVVGNKKIMDIGGHVVLGGLLFQLLVLPIYLWLVVRFKKQAEREVVYVRRWRWHVWVLVVAVAAIWLRNLVRAIEFAQGFYGFINQNEAMVYIFDSFLMFAVMVLFALFYPGNLVQGDAQSYRDISMRRTRVTSEQVKTGPFGPLA